MAKCGTSNNTLRLPTNSYYLSTKMSSKSAIVIGAGACGLAALKELVESGITDITAYECLEKIGGVFANYQPHYNLTISNHLMAFSDFPFPSTIMYSFLKDYHDYLNLYVEKFKLLKYIQFKCMVTKCKLNQNEKWEVTIESNGKIVTRVVDHVVVASGAHMKPYVPDLSGFTGDVIHSRNWNDEKLSIKEKKQRALVIGIGESSADVIEDTSRLAVSTHVLSRRTPLLAARLLNHYESECSTGNVYPLNEYLEMYTTGRIFNHTSLGISSIGGLLKWGSMALDKNNHFNQGGKWMIKNLFEHPTKNDHSGFVCKNAKLGECVQQGRVELVIAKNATYDGKKVTFSNGKVIEVDVIVLCTGFEITFPFLDIPDLDMCPRKWFKHSIPIKYGQKGLYFVGFGRPHQGGIPPVGEMQARYISMLINGTRVLPNNYAEIAKIEAEREQSMYVDSPKLMTLCDYPAIMDSLARLIGCEPSLPILIRTLSFLAFFLVPLTFLSKHLNLEIVNKNYIVLVLFTCFVIIAQFSVYDCLLLKYLFYPNWSCWYRMSGTGAKPEILNAVLSKYPAIENILPRVFSVAIIVQLVGIITIYPVTIVFNMIGILLTSLGVSSLEWLMTPRGRLLHGANLKLKEVCII